MVTELTIPVLDQTTESVALTTWLKREGDSVEQGEGVCEIETDKATVEVQAPASGRLRQILIQAGTQVPPRTVVGLIAEADEALPVIDPYYRTLKAAAAAKAPPPSPAPAAVGAAPAAKLIVSPRARRLAEEHHIDLTTLQGTGPGGRILEEDVQQALAAATTPAPAAPTAPSSTRAAHTKAERVSRAWQTIPHFYTTLTVDLTRIAALKAAGDSAVTYTDYFALALGRALPAHPSFNGHWQAERNALETLPEVRLGLVVEAEHGLVIVTLADLRGRGLADIAAERAGLVAQARAGKLPAEALAVPTFTLSNVGAGHIDQFSAIISPPQVAILSAGSVQMRPWVAGTQLVVRPVVTLTLGADHRAVDGRHAARFLEDLKRELEAEP